MPTDITTAQNFVFEDSDLTPEIAQNHVDDVMSKAEDGELFICLLYTSPSPRDLSTSRMPSSA